MPMSAKEIGRYVARVGLFKRRGMSVPEAEAHADRVALRDQQRDDRRSCIECESWQRGNERTGVTCFHAEQARRARMDAKDAGEKPARMHALSPIQPMPTLLQRCASFTFQKP